MMFLRLFGGALSRLFDRNDERLAHESTSKMKITIEKRLKSKNRI
jgi:hypothetical protein